MYMYILYTNTILKQRINKETDSHQIFWKGWPSDWEELITFWELAVQS